MSRRRSRSKSAAWTSRAAKSVFAALDSRPIDRQAPKRPSPVSSGELQVAFEA
jgi:hypothetical protein